MSKDGFGPFTASDVPTIFQQQTSDEPSLFEQVGEYRRFHAVEWEEMKEEGKDLHEVILRAMNDYSWGRSKLFMKGTRMLLGMDKGVGGDHSAEVVYDFGGDRAQLDELLRDRDWWGGMPAQENFMASLDSPAPQLFPPPLPAIANLEMDKILGRVTTPKLNRKQRRKKKGKTWGKKK